MDITFKIILLISASVISAGLIKHGLAVGWRPKEKCVGKRVTRYCGATLAMLFILTGLTACGGTSQAAATTSESRGASVSSSEAETTDNNTVSGQLKVHYINVGQADSILIQQGNSSMLIDAGNNEDAQTVKNYISDQGVTKLDYVVGTHPHEDHIGGLDYVINSFQIGKIYMPKVTSNTKTFEDVITAIKNKNMQITTPIPGDSFKLGDATYTILAPNSSSYDDLNNYSIVIKIKFGENTFLFDGDAGAVSEMEMVNKGFDLKADVLKIGHHGSKTATCANFLSAVSPKYAVISVGTGNTYGHPAQSTMDRLKASGIQVYRTDENGTIIAISNGKDITFNTAPGSYNGITSNESNKQ